MRRRYKKKPFRPIDREQFKTTRHMQNLTQEQVAKLLRVTTRTVAHWELGTTRIPYSAFKLLRVLVNGEIISEAWAGWSINGDTLYSPSGRAFKQHQLMYLSNYLTMARYWQAEYELRVNARMRANPRNFRLLQGGLST